LAAAETAADIAGVMRTQGDPGEAEEYATPFETIPIERRLLMTLPEGYDITQFKAEQPQSTYSDVKREIIGEIARCLEIPVHLAIGDSSKHNYSSARLDNQSYVKARKVDRSRITHDIMDPLFNAWLREAMLIEGYLPQRLRNVRTDWTHTWIYDGDEHVDPIKEANAQRVRLESLTTTLADEWGSKGHDWEEKLEQIAREKAKRESLGLDFGAVTAAPDEDNTEDANASVKILRDSDGNMSGWTVGD
jgi:capsid protein